MRFVIVNDRVPMRAPHHCACCTEAFEKGYVREIATDLKYCDMVCFRFSERVAIAAIEDHARRVS